MLSRKKNSNLIFILEIKIKCLSQKLFLKHIISNLRKWILLNKIYKEIAFDSFKCGTINNDSGTINKFNNCSFCYFKSWKLFLKTIFRDLILLKYRIQNKWIFEKVWAILLFKSFKFHASYYIIWWVSGKKAFLNFHSRNKSKEYVRAAFRSM